MRRTVRFVMRVVLLLVPVGIGAALLARAVSEREPLVVVAEAEVAPAVRVITMECVNFVPEVSVFGTVEPASSWSALAQVSGEVVRLAPDLRPGRLVHAGTEIIRIDATDYELAEAQAKARLAGAEARFAELETRHENLRASLEIERRALALGEIELERRQTLVQRQATSQAAAEQAEEALLQRRGRVQEIENQLRLLPAQKRAQEAEREVARAQLEEARLSIARTVIEMPFDGRIAEVSVERSQFVTTGQILLVAEDIARAEVAAPLRLDQLEALVADRLKLASVVDLSASGIDALPQELGLSATLHLAIAGRAVSWSAEVRRLSFALDPQTRTIGLVVVVDEPFRQAVPGERPPLVRDMFVEVRVRGEPRQDALLLPREALDRDGTGWVAHVVDAEGRLRRQPIQVDGMFGNVTLLADGLEPGARVVVGELPIAIEGMLVEAHEDEALKRRLAGSGQEPAP